MNLIAEVTFWTSVAFIAYSYVGYPLLVLLRAGARERVTLKSHVEPTVSVIVAAHNEQDNIGRRIENLLASKYPAGKLEIVIASDGSSDDTCKIASKYVSQRVKLLDLVRTGKPGALNSAVAHCTGEILVFTDADTTFAPSAIHELVSNFADATVGGVTGLTRYLSADKTDCAIEGEGKFLQFEMWMKRFQTRSGSVVAAQGDIYGIRRELFEKVPDGVTDDFFISSGVIRHGFRLISDHSAVALETPSPTANAEFARKVRIVTLGLRGLMARRELLNPFKYGFYSVQLFSQKLARRCVPIFLLALLISSLSLSSPVYRFIGLSQLCFYAAAIIGYATRKSRINAKVFSIPLYFTLVNVAAFVAIVQLLTGTGVRNWTPRAKAQTAHL